MTAADSLEDILRFGCLAADHELLNKPVPVSSVRRPDGGLQSETPAERTRRIVRTAVLHLIEQGLLAIPDDIEQRLDNWIPATREDTA